MHRMIVATQEAPGTTNKYRSIELETIQSLPMSPFGMQFLRVPVASAPIPSYGSATTRSCDETSSDGKSKLDCVDDDD